MSFRISSSIWKLSFAETNEKSDETNERLHDEKMSRGLSRTGSAAGAEQPNLVAVLFASVYGLASGITAVTRATLPLELFPAGTYARATAQMALPLNLAYASAPPAFTAIMTTAGPQAALWLALVMSVIAFCMLLNLVRHRLKYQPDQ